jgi:hypothetical protein
MPSTHTSRAMSRHEDIVWSNGERRAALAAIGRLSRRRWRDCGEGCTHAGRATHEEIPHGDLRGQCLRRNEWKPDADADQQWQRRAAHQSQEPNGENDPEAAGHQQEGRARGADEPPAWGLHVVQSRPLPNRTAGRLIEITRQAESLAVGFRYCIDASAIAACQRWSVNHHKRRITGNALERGDHCLVFSNDGRRRLRCSQDQT